MRANSDLSLPIHFQGKHLKLLIIDIFLILKVQRYLVKFSQKLKVSKKIFQTKDTYFSI